MFKFLNPSTPKALQKAAALFLLCLWGVGMVGSTQVRAEDQPPSDCYCGTDKGAVNIGVKKTPQECYEACKKDGHPVVAFAYNNDQRPEANLKCFTQLECEGPKGLCEKDPNDPDHDFVCHWDKVQPQECIGEGSVRDGQRQPAQHYCYKTPVTPFKLSTPINGKDTIENYGEYVAVGFDYLLKIAVTLTVVMIMVGGFQYILASGVEGVKDGKERIKQAIIGFVLLMLTYIIFYTVNPQTLKLEPPQMPAIKRVKFVGEGTDCNIFKSVYKAKLDDDHATSGVAGKYTCGSRADVIEKGAGAHNAEQIATAKFCYYKNCPNPDETCVQLNTSTWKCIKCTELVEGNQYKIDPNPVTCNMLSKGDEPKDPMQPKTEVNRCVFVEDTSLTNKALNPTRTAFGIKSGLCTDVKLKCQGLTSCYDYESVIKFDKKAKESMISICTEDPCRLAPPNEACRVENYGSTLGCVNSGYLENKPGLDKTGKPIDFTNERMDEGPYEPNTF